METEKENMNLILVRIRIAHPTKENTGAELNFVFDSQPTGADIMDAYADEPFWARSEDRDIYGPVLQQCLKTYGVPNLGVFKLVDAENYSKAVPMIEAVWNCNIVGRDHSFGRANFGDIRLTYKELRIVTSPEPVKIEAPAAKMRKRAAKKTDKISIPPVK